MSQVSIFLPDGSQKSFEKAPTVLELAQSIGPRLAQDTLGAKIKGEEGIWDLRETLPANSHVEILTLKSPQALEVLRHTSAHIMAQAVQSLWPEVKVTIGPVIEAGFYYDFDSPHPFSEEDFPCIEKKMEEIVQANYSLERRFYSDKEAKVLFSRMGESYKVEIIEDLKEPQVSVYEQGPWKDLCRGPHVQSTGQVKVFKLLSVAGAYWRGDERRPQLQRIYATAFAHKKDLKEYLQLREEAQKRDHRKAGRALNLFFFHPYAPGTPFFTEKGTVIYKELMKYLRELYVKYDYQEVITPQIYQQELYEISGHYENYRENMFFAGHEGLKETSKKSVESSPLGPSDSSDKLDPLDKGKKSKKIKEYSLSFKPMNCPGHCLIFKAEKRSYRDLPYRIADFGRLHRYERSGVVHGLTRAYGFCQDDAHIFCTLEQMQQEIKSFVRMLQEIYHQLEMKNFKVCLSTRPKKRMGSDTLWDQAEEALHSAMKSLNMDYKVNEGDGAFYGPKLDMMFEDVLKRSHQLGTIQCDFNMPLNFKLKYVDEKNTLQTPVLLHRAALGSFERFIGVYLEHSGAHLPTWLSPVQVEILNITDRVDTYCRKLWAQLREKGFRVHYDDRNEKLNLKIRQAQLAKVPYMLIIGDREAEKGLLSLRLRQQKVLSNMAVETFLTQVQKEIQERHPQSPFLQADV